MQPTITKIVTKDNSTTFYNKEYQETYHSKSGAAEESTEKFAKPALKYITEDTQEVSVLDICFGLGYNSAATIDLLKQIKPNIIINVVALENDREIIAQIQNIQSTFKSYSIIKQLTLEDEVHLHNVNIKLLLGDARETIKQIQTKFDIIFLDPFSPKKCPELWTAEFFKSIYKLTKPTTILTTYSCARSVRDNLRAAGFQVKDGPSVGRRAPSTIAIL